MSHWKKYPPGQYTLYNATCHVGYIPPPPPPPPPPLDILSTSPDTITYGILSPPPPPTVPLSGHYNLRYIVPPPPTVPLSGHYNLRYIVPPPPPSSTTRGVGVGWVGGGQYSLQLFVPLHGSYPAGYSKDQKRSRSFRSLTFESNLVSFTILPLTSVSAETWHRE